MYASAGNHPHTCNELIAFHPNLTESNENGDTAYSLAIKNKSHLGTNLKVRVKWGNLESFLLEILICFHCFRWAKEKENN